MVRSFKWVRQKTKDVDCGSIATNWQTQTHSLSTAGSLVTDNDGVISMTANDQVLWVLLSITTDSEKEERDWAICMKIGPPLLHQFFVCQLARRCLSVPQAPKWHSFLFPITLSIYAHTHIIIINNQQKLKTVLKQLKNKRGNFSQKVTIWNGIAGVVW